jgi:hypothetical protein
MNDEVLESRSASCVVSLGSSVHGADLAQVSARGSVAVLDSCRDADRSRYSANGEAADSRARGDWPLNERSRLLSITNQFHQSIVSRPRG